MNPLSIISVSLVLLQGVLAGLGKNTAYVKIVSEIQAAIDALTRAHGEVVTNPELESLRTTPQW